MKRSIALLILLMYSFVWNQPTEMKGSYWIRKSLTVDSTPAAHSPRSIIVKDSATSNKFKEWDLDTFLVWLNTHGSGSSPHGIDSSYLAYSTGGSTWGKLPLRLYFSSQYETYLGFVNSPFENSGEKAFTINAPDTTRIIMRAGTGSFVLSSEHSAYGGTFGLFSASGSRGSSDVSAYRLRLTADSIMTIKGRNIVIRDNSGTFMSFDGLVANGAVNVSRKLRFSSLPTITSTVSVYAPSGDTVALIRADSLTVKRAATAAVSDSTAKNSPHGVTTGRHAVSSGTNTWSTSTIREADSCVGIGVTPSSDRKLSLSFAPLNAGGYGVIAAFSPRITTDGYFGGSVMRFLGLTNISAANTDLQASVGLDGFMFHNSAGRSYGGVIGLQFGYGTLGTGTGRCDRAYGIIIDPTSEGNGPIPLMMDMYIGPRHGAVTPTADWSIYSDHNAASRLEGSLQIDNDVSRQYYGENQQASIFHDGTDMIFNTTAGLFWFTGASARFGSSTKNVRNDSLGTHFSGTAQKWNDVADMALTSVKGAGSAGEPTWTATGLGFNLNQFAIGDSLQGDCELTHEFIQGDTSDFHIHYHVNGSNVDARHVGATIDIDIFNANGDSITYHYRGNVYDTIPANTKHMTQRMVSTGKVYTPGINIGAKIYGVVIRIAHGTAPTNNPFFATIGMHHKIDEMGSTGVYTK